jgi:hypothetical protein
LPPGKAGAILFYLPAGRQVRSKQRGIDLKTAFGGLKSNKKPSPLQERLFMYEI